MLSNALTSAVKIMNATRKILGLLISSLALLGLAVHAIAADDDTGHSGHNMQAVPDMLADGRRVDENAPRHEMSDAQLAGLRKKIALYRALTDREARMNMAMMSPNYEWYVSDLGMQGDVGVIVLSHGVGKNSDRIFVDSLDHLGTH